MIMLRMCFSVNQIDDLQSSNKKYIVMDLPSSVDFDWFLAGLAV